MLPSREAMLAAHNRPIFDKPTFAAFLLKVPAAPAPNTSPDELAEALDAIMRDYAFSRYQQNSSSNAVIAKDAEKIAKACADILSVTGLNRNHFNESDLAPHLGGKALFAAAAARGEQRGKAATMNALRAVHTLLGDAEKVAEHHRALSQRRSHSRGRAADKALPKAVGLLAHLYIHAWGQRPTVSRSTGTAGGPFVAFLEAFFAIAHDHKIDTPRTADQLGKVWERSPSYAEHQFLSGRIDA